MSRCDTFQGNQAHKNHHSSHPRSLEPFSCHNSSNFGPKKVATQWNYGVKIYSLLYYAQTSLEIPHESTPQFFRIGAGQLFSSNSNINVGGMTQKTEIDYFIFSV